MSNVYLNDIKTFLRGAFFFLLALGWTIYLLLTALIMSKGGSMPLRVDSPSWAKVWGVYRGEYTIYMTETQERFSEGRVFAMNPVFFTGLIPKLNYYGTANINFKIDNIEVGDSLEMSMIFTDEQGAIDTISVELHEFQGEYMGNAWIEQFTPPETFELRIKEHDKERVMSAKLN